MPLLVIYYHAYMYISTCIICQLLLLLQFIAILLSFLDDAVSAEPVSVGSSCSGGVALLPCGSRLMQQGTALRETLNLNLTWRRNGEELTLNPETEVSQDPGIFITCMHISLRNFLLVKSSWECMGCTHLIYALISISLIDL